MGCDLCADRKAIRDFVIIVLINFTRFTRGYQAKTAGAPFTNMV